MLELLARPYRERIPVAASVLASVVAGLPTLVGFFVWHWFNLAPVWGVLIEATLSFPVGVLGIAWAWRRSRSGGRFGGRRGGLAFGAIFAGGVVIAELISLARGRPPTPVGGSAVAVEVLFATFPLVPIALAGWRLTRGWQGAVAYAIAGLALDLHLGGTVMHLGGTGSALMLFAILLVSYVFAGLILASLEPWIATVLRR